MKGTRLGPAEVPREQLTASVQALTLPKGLYMFSLRSAPPERTSATAQLVLPAVQVGLAPGGQAAGVEFLSGRDDGGHWLYAPEDILVAKVAAEAATILLTSVRAAGMEPVDVEIDRLSVGTEPAAAGEAKPEPATQRVPLRLQISTHISNRGDITFIDTEWAGRMGHGMSIEAFSVVPLGGLSAADIEYKALTGAGFETPWLANGEVCGTRGMGIPLVGFAVRLKPNATARGFACDYRGSFRSGAIAGPIRDGELCRSTAAEDPLEGIELRIVGVQGAAAGAIPAGRAALRRGAPDTPGRRPDPVLGSSSGDAR